VEYSIPFHHINISLLVIKTEGDISKIMPKYQDTHLERTQITTLSLYTKDDYESYWYIDTLSNDDDFIKWWVDHVKTWAREYKVEKKDYWVGNCGLILDENFKSKSQFTMNGGERYKEYKASLNK
jgi:hypothetical protein